MSLSSFDGFTINVLRSLVGDSEPFFFRIGLLEATVAKSLGNSASADLALIFVGDAFLGFQDRLADEKSSRRPL